MKTNISFESCHTKTRRLDHDNARPDSTGDKCIPVQTLETDIEAVWEHKLEGSSETEKAPNCIEVAILASFIKAQPARAARRTVPAWLSEKVGKRQDDIFFEFFFEMNFFFFFFACERSTFVYVSPSMHKT